MITGEESCGVCVYMCTCDIIMWVVVIQVKLAAAVAAAC